MASIDNYTLGVDGSTIEHLGSCGQARRFRLGECIAAQGSRAEEVFLVLEGEVEVVLSRKGKKDLSLAVLGQGSLVGEMGPFLSGSCRSAALVARSAVTVLSIDKNRFLNVLCRTPGLMQKVLATMAERISDLNQKLLEHQSFCRYLQTVLSMMCLERPSNSDLVDLEFAVSEATAMTGLRRAQLTDILDGMKRNRVLGGWYISEPGKIHCRIKWNALLKSIYKDC